MTISSVIALLKTIPKFEAWFERLILEFVEYKKKENKKEFVDALRKAASENSVIDLRNSLGKSLDD
jgi:non-homologous end joining protein Ku